MENFRTDFTNKFLQKMQTDSRYVQSKEIGILRARYSQLYDATPVHLRMRLLEQLLMAVKFFIIFSKEIHPSDDIMFIAHISRMSSTLDDMFTEYATAFEHLHK